MNFIKKSLVIVLVLVLAMAIMPATTLANDTITIIIDGQAVVFEGQEPIMEDGRILIPARFVFEDLGFNVVWDIPNQTATLERYDYVITIRIGDSHFTVNGTSHELDVPAQLVGGRTMLPVGPILRAVGYDPIWSSQARTITINTTSTNFVVPAIFDMLDHVALSTKHLYEIYAVVNADENWEAIRSAAEAGVPVAQLIYGGLVSAGRTGQGVKSEEALMWLHKAIENGITRAMYEISYIYQRLGYDELSRHWMRQAIDHGVAVAEYQAAISNRWLPPYDYERAVYFYRMAAAQGHIRATAELAWMAFHGLGMPQSYEEAAQLYRITAEVGYAYGQMRLAYMYLHGWGKPSNYDGAIFWFTQSAMQRNNNAMHRLGSLYFEGRGVEQDYENALYWFTQEALYGFGWSNEYRAVLYEKGYYVTGISPIYHLLRVEYTVLPTVYERDYANKGDDWPYITRWQFVELHDFISYIRSFTTVENYDLSQYDFETESGDIILITWGHNNRTYLLFYLGDGRFGSRYVRG